MRRAARHHLRQQRDHPVPDFSVDSSVVRPSSPAARRSSVCRTSATSRSALRVAVATLGVAAACAVLAATTGKSAGSPRHHVHGCHRGRRHSTRTTAVAPGKMPAGDAPDQVWRLSTWIATVGRTCSSSAARTGRPVAAFSGALYRNTGKGTFTDITVGSGLDVDDVRHGRRCRRLRQRWARGISTSPPSKATGCSTTSVTAVCRRDEDGGHQQRQLRHERRVARLRQKDGRLDLFVGNYVQWTEKGDLRCSLDGVSKSCTPESYKGVAARLFHNLGNGRFEDVAARAGVGDPTSKSLGVTVLDYNSTAGGHLRRQRYAAQQALSQQQERHL